MIDWRNVGTEQCGVMGQTNAAFSHYHKRAIILRIYTQTIGKVEMIRNCWQIWNLLTNLHGRHCVCPRAPLTKFVNKTTNANERIIPNKNNIWCCQVISCSFHANLIQSCGWQLQRTTCATPLQRAWTNVGWRHRNQSKTTKLVACLRLNNTVDSHR